MKRRFFILPAALAAAMAALFLTAGCETDDEFDHTPPAGQGSIVIDNFTYTDIEFFVNGVRRDVVNEDDDQAFDFAPGVYRVVLNDEDGDRSWAGDVDVLQDRLTVLRVRISTGSFDDYVVDREIQ